MTKRIIALLFAVLLCMVSLVPAFAESDYVRLIDQAEVLSEDEELELLAQLDEISERQQFDVVVCIVDSLMGDDIEALADDVYDEFGYGYGEDCDGALLLVSVDDGLWHISTCGYGITALTDYGIQYIGEQMLPDLKADDFYGAAETYASYCDEFVTSANNGEPFDVNNAPKGSFPFVKNILIAIGVGLAIALVVTLIMKAQLKSVRFKSEAADYEKPGSMHVTDAHEFFLYRNVSRVKKAESNGGSSTHTSSSGTTHGGGGGSF